MKTTPRWSQQGQLLSLQTCYQDWQTGQVPVSFPVSCARVLFAASLCHRVRLPRLQVPVETRPFCGLAAPFNIKARSDQLIEKVGFTLSNRVGHVVLKFLLQGFYPFINVRLDGRSVVTVEKVVVPQVGQYFT